MSVHAIILAAGFGTRLRPITEWTPKPLMPIGDTPLLAQISTALTDAGVTRLAVNTHHLPDAINAYVAGELTDQSITVYHEPEILGTGGPLVNARELLSDADCFILFNGDILSDIDLSALVASHLSGGQAVTMALIDGPENKLDVDVDSQGHAIVVDILDKLGRGESGHQRLTYSGISVYSPEIFDYLPAEPEFCSIITAILKLMEEKPRSVAGYIQENLYWNDLGTVEKFLETNRDLVAGKTPFQPPHGGADHGVTRLAEQGSAREFYRLTVCGESRVLMRSSAEDADFDRFIEFGELFTKLNLQTPEIHGFNPDNFCVLMEDLGDTTLNSWVTSRSSAGDIERQYQRVIDELVRYQTGASAALTAQAGIQVREFDFDYLRWETSYFKENYLQAVRHMDDAELSGLDDEFDRLAADALAMPYRFLHRDFQSQNIMVTDDGIRFVDFQGGRMGPCAYDVMSLVNDPYVPLDYEFRQRLMAYYVNQLPEATSSGHDAHRWLQTAGLQRIMQALGAYGFLSLKKGKMVYQEYIPLAETYLRELLATDDRFPVLKRLVG